MILSIMAHFLVADEVQFESEEPPHRAFASLGDALERYIFPSLHQKNLQKSYAIQKEIITLSSVIIAIMVCKHLYFSLTF